MLNFHSIPLPIVLSGAAIAYLVWRLYANRVRGDGRKLSAEIGQECESLRRVVEALPELLESARRSRVGCELDVDLAEARLLKSQLPETGGDTVDGSGMDLDIKLAEILALSIRANRLWDKYRRAASEDHSLADCPPQDLEEEGLFEQAASLPAQVHAQHAAMSFIGPS